MNKTGMLNKDHERAGKRHNVPSTVVQQSSSGQGMITVALSHCSKFLPCNAMVAQYMLSSCVCLSCLSDCSSICHMLVLCQNS